VDSHSNIAYSNKHSAAVPQRCFEEIIQDIYAAFGLPFHLNFGGLNNHELIFMEMKHALLWNIC